LLTAEDQPAAPLILKNGQIKDYAIKLRCGSPVTRIDRSHHLVSLHNGDVFAYDRLLLATGSTSRQLNTPGVRASNVHYLRTLGEGLALRSKLRPGSKLIIVGGGFIGLEIAASARDRGVDVTLLECAPRLLARGVPAEIANAIERRHRSAGVKLEFDVALRVIKSESGRHRVEFSSGGEIGRIEGDCIVAGIGAIPDTELAARSGLAVENGVKVDAEFHTSDPDIFAVGDCCSFPHALYGGRRIRLESWRNAQEQGTLVARNMLGAHESYQAVPWFWSDQYELTVQVAGLFSEGDETIVRKLGDAQLYFHLDGGGRLVAASGFGLNSAIAKDIRFAERLVAERAMPDRLMLGSPNVRLRSLLASY
jgi:3-phenylpropionate/trans-cinnamate dioxygenase ferredoxin reductase subunit